MKIRIGRNLSTSVLAACVLAFGGSAFADVVTRAGGNMLTEFGRASPSRHDGAAHGVRALQPNVAEVGRGGFERLMQSPGTIVGTSRVSGDYVKGGSATLQDIPFGRR
jgi:hypothetical protein